MASPEFGYFTACKTGKVAVQTYQIFLYNAAGVI